MTKMISWMKTSFLTLVLISWASSLPAFAIDKYSELIKYPRIHGEAIIKLNAKLDPGKALHSLEKIDGVRLLQVIPNAPLFVKIVFSSDLKLVEFLKTVKKNKTIQYAEPNYLYKITAPQQPLEIFPNDAEFSKLWGLKNTGQMDSSGQAGIAGADINATKAWLQQKGSQNIKVAVIDTGVDYNHPDLAVNIYTNPGEFGDGKESNGIDDDGNGYVDDVHGWNFAGGNNDPMDDHNHGTHCAGTIGAIADNGVGVSGVAWHVSIVPIKFLTSNGSGSLENALQGILYATKLGVNIMSNSWGGGPFSQALYDAIAEAKNKGILFIAAAGNDSENSDINPHYPSGYQLDNVISVAATDNRDQLANFSTWGKNSVHIAAPGVKILSTLRNNSYGVFSGTSMATPHVAGAAAILFSQFPNLSYQDIRAKIINTRDPKIQLARRVASSGRLNLYNALNDIIIPSDEPQESQWVDGNAISLIESAHPYVDNTTQEWSISGPANAKYMRVRFSSYDLEPRFDVVRITGADSIEADAISGISRDPYYSWYVEGNKVKIKFTSDTSVTAWGFAIDSYQYIPK